MTDQDNLFTQEYVDALRDEIADRDVVIEWAKNVLTSPDLDHDESILRATNILAHSITDALAAVKAEARAEGARDAYRTTLIHSIRAALNCSVVEAAIRADDALHPTQTAGDPQ